MKKELQKCSERKREEERDKSCRYDVDSKGRRGRRRAPWATVFHAHHPFYILISPLLRRLFKGPLRRTTRWHPFNIIILPLSLRLSRRIIFSLLPFFFFFLSLDLSSPLAMSNVPIYRRGDEFLRKCYAVTWNQCKTVERVRSRRHEETHMSAQCQPRVLYT